MPAEAQIKDVFSISGRGFVLVLENGFTGTIRSGGTVSGSRGKARFKGPEFLDNTKTGEAWLGILVDIPDAKEIFRPGDTVLLFDPDVTIH